MNNWIKVGDVPVEQEEEVVISGFLQGTNTRYVEVARYCGEDFFDLDTGDEFLNVTHYMRIQHPEN